MDGLAWDCSCGVTNPAFAMVCGACGQLPIPVTSKRAGGWSAVVASGPFIDAPEAVAAPVPFEPPPPAPEARPQRRPSFFDQFDEPPPAPPAPVRRRRVRLSAGHVVAFVVLVIVLVVIANVASRVGDVKPPDPTQISQPAP